ncbi:MAG: bifunctional (p)ppGpp synthetase/guanosine-3',5'-bis(diphosphate) 3'-pyrophosphohydrolase [Granulosicoccaceae bacterium]
MRHVFSADTADFATEELSAAHLCAGLAPAQSAALRNAVKCYWQARQIPTHYPDSLHVAAQLKGMRADAATLAAALLGSNVMADLISVDQIRNQFGDEVAKLTQEVRWLNELSMTEVQVAGHLGTQDKTELLRRMVLSMVNDMRVILVKLAFRTQRLYALAATDANVDSRLVAEETLTIFAPLANRLGLGQLKWELEDVAFRLVEPQAYKRIAKALEENRQDREYYVNDFVTGLEVKLRENQLADADVLGRPKHIYSIWKKMRAKRIEFDDLFDVRAVRVLVDSLQQCYGVLGVVHSIWQPISREFDDYIAKPKANGYQSLHTAVIGPQGKAVEVQIRTHEMNDDAENGVAAHWAYKEGGSRDASIQRSVNSLKQLLEGNDEQLVEDFTQHIDEARVYVFTPKGEVVDLVSGSTPLDFAYHVHSEIGHRCRGAKVDGSIVPLTYALRNGDQIEVLTTREAAPSRDWLNKSLGYLASSRARGKVRAWFNTQDHDQHVADGRHIVDRELKRLKASSVSIEKLSRKLKIDKTVDLYACVGRNEITSAQIAGAVDHLSEPAERLVVNEKRTQKPVKGSVSVRGVGNLLTQMAVCCKPVPHDAIVGFITRGKGVSVHRADCNNILNLREEERERLIDVEWGSDTTGDYRVEIQLEAFNRVGLIRDVSAAVANFPVGVVAMQTLTNPDQQQATMKIGLHISTMADLTPLMDKLRQLRNVHSVERVI